MLHGVQKLIFFGDSLTDGAAWPDWIVNTLNAHGYPDLSFHNAGIGGNTIHQMRTRLQADVLSLHPDLVIMHAGTNDARDPQTSSEEYHQNLDYIVRTLIANKVRVLLLTLPTVRDDGRANRQIMLDKITYSVAHKYNCPVANTRTAFDEALATGKILHEPDGVHHTLDGWRIMASTVMKALGSDLPVEEIIAHISGTVCEWFISPPQQLPFDFSTATAQLSPLFDPNREHWKRFDANKIKPNLNWWLQTVVDRGAIFPLGNPEQVDNAGAFAAAKVLSRNELTTLMRVGGSSRAIWLNGELVWDQAESHGVHADAARFPVTLHKGINRIVVFSESFFYLSLG
ncbi:MAG TPA: GDSL-type esterase/lipase family protein [Armatimonadota bacterium]|nr:GDSL-type esterase/lipase family protein [Armatimonadota bacterium]